ncbi:MAG: N-acetylneuraminate synthase family protein, partial [Pseudomonadota bacterium]
SARIEDEPAGIGALFDERIAMVPLLDSVGRLAAVASAGEIGFAIDGIPIGDDQPTFFIAEIGNNHNGSLELACRLVDEAAAAGAQCAKFQMRQMSRLYAIDAAAPSADLGAAYTLDLLARFQLSNDDLLRALDYTHRRGLVPLCTPWDEESFRLLEDHGVAAYKIASADFTNHDLITEVASARKPMICSTGMASESEIVDGARLLRGLGAPFVLLHCNSTYPTPFKDVNLAYLKRLRELSGGPVGYSGHERDINVSIAAVAMGARVVERHITMDRLMEGNDHKVSLLPDEFQRMIEGARQVEAAMGSAADRTISQGELINRETLAKSLAAAVDIPADVPIQPGMLKVISPGQGLQPNRKRELIGRRLSTPKRAGDFFFDSDLGAGHRAARPFDFPLAWGVPVRFHDVAEMRASTNLQLVEFHLSYKDLDLDWSRFVEGAQGLALVVHAPELFAGDHTLDLCSADTAYRLRSIAELQRVIDLTRALTPLFDTPRPCIVTNVGGFSEHRPLDVAARAPMMARLHESLAALDCDGVEILPQTMPPFPWHFGGQRLHNLFVDPAEVARFCEQTGMRVCFDVSHTKLATTHLGQSFSDAVSMIAPHTAHLHLADAAGIDGEGLQIGEGDIDWRAFWRGFLASNTTATMIPEVWQGHKNGGEGAWTALDRLERQLKGPADAAASSVA